MQKKLTNKGAQKKEKLDGQGQVQDLGDAVTKPTDGAKSSAKADKAVKGKSKVPTTKSTKTDKSTPDEEKKLKKAVAESLIALEGLSDDQLERMNAILAEAKDEDADDEKDKEEVEEEDDCDDEKDKEEVDEDSEEDDEEEDDKEDKKKFPVKEEDIEIDMSDDVSALFSNEDLSEDFKSKATTIFNSAVKTKVASVVTTLDEAWEDAIEAAIEEAKDELSDKLNGYCQYVSEEWMKENKVAVENGIKTEIIEGFIGGMKDLFSEHYIDVPAEKVDVVEEQAMEITQLKADINAIMNKNIAINEELSSLKRDDIVNSVCRDLADTEIEKIAELAENVEFVDSDDYTAKVTTLKESYFPKSKANRQLLDEDIQHTNDDTDKTVNKRVSKYADFIK